VLRMKVEKMLVLNLVQVGQDRLKLVMIKVQVLGDQTRAEYEKFFDFFPDASESFRTLKHEIDETHVMIGVQVRDVDGLQVGENVTNAVAANEEEFLRRSPT